MPEEKIYPLTKEQMDMEDEWMLDRALECIKQHLNAYGKEELSR